MDFVVTGVQYDKNSPRY